MPVCNKCKKFSYCLTVDFCEHCGAKDWKAETKRTAKEYFFDAVLEVAGVLLRVTFIIGVLLGGLWALVTLVKFMWQHS
jgi:hypothetical protein